MADKKKKKRPAGYKPPTTRKPREKDAKGRWARKGTGTVRRRPPKNSGMNNKTLSVNQGSVDRDMIREQVLMPGEQEAARTYEQAHREALERHKNSGLSPDQLRDVAHTEARTATKEAHGDDMVNDLSVRVFQQLADPTVSTYKENWDDLYGTDDQPGLIDEQQLWRTWRGTLPYRDGQTLKDRETVATRVNADVLAEQPIPETLASMRPTQKAELRRLGMMDDEGRLSPAGKLYVQAFSATNANHEDLMHWLESGASREAPLKGTYRDPLRGAGKARRMAQEQIRDEIYNTNSYLTDKFESSKGTHKGFSFGVRGANAPSLEELRKQFPNSSDDSLIALREARRETIKGHMMDANERSAFESRQLRMSGRKNRNAAEPGDEVVVFTTNLGQPTVSVPASSLIGQYIINKRKRMVVDDKVTRAGRKDVRGTFPEAVRDQHLIEFGTGISLGVEGRGGLFQETGWKYKAKRSKGYANKAPLGAQILRDKSGLPLYDEKGNIRYTDGYTRPFEAGTDRAVGLRIFIG